MAAGSMANTTLSGRASGSRTWVFPPAPALTAEQIVEHMMPCDLPPALAYRRRVLLIKATLECCQLLAHDLRGFSEAMGWGPNRDIDDLPDAIGATISDACLQEELDRIDRVFGGKGSAS